jgi:hypothetical protein
MKTINRRLVIEHCKSAVAFLLLCTMLIAQLSISSCTKVIDVTIPDSAKQVVVDGSIEINTPPVIMLTSSQKFFSTVDLNNLGQYFVHGASIRVNNSDGGETDLIEYCLQNLNLPDQQKQILLSALGFSTADSAALPDICIYTVPDIVNYFVTGTCSFMGKERTTYNLDIVAPPLYGNDSVHLTSATYIPTAIGIDSLVIREATNPSYKDSMSSVYAYITVPDTFGNFVRYKTKRNSEPFYAPEGGGSVYDDRLFVGLTIGLPLERGQNPSSNFDFETATLFWKGDTVTIKWSNIDSKTYDFFFTLENDGGDSPFSSPVKIKTNINNGLGVWAGYATKYYDIIVPR